MLVYTNSLFLSQKKSCQKVPGTFWQLFDEFGVGRGVCGIMKKILSVLRVGQVNKSGWNNTK